MASCFGTLKIELVQQACYPTRDAARHDLFAIIERYHNRQRLHSSLGYITPPNRQSAKPLNSVSTESGEGHPPGAAFSRFQEAAHTAPLIAKPRPRRSKSPRCAVEIVISATRETPVVAVSRKAD